MSTGTSVGSVSITVTDADQFSSTITITVQPALLQVLDNNNVILKLNETYIANFEGGSGTITWVSSDETVATVDGNGVIQANNSNITGTTTITVSDSYNQVQSFEVEVRNVSVESSTNSIEVTQSTLQLTAVGGSGSYTWSSDNEGVAKVDANGLLTLLTAGSVTITAIDADGFSGTTTINVIYPPLTISETFVLLAVNNSVDLSATGGDENYSWSSSNTSVAEVSSSGRVTAKSAGTATITLSDGAGNSLTASIEVRSISLSASSSSVYVGSSITITASGGNEPYTWSSSNTNVATVSSSGVVTGRNAGTVIITAKDDDGFSGTITITVNSFFGGGGGGH
jgi:uncharacterized protein YjdB